MARVLVVVPAFEEAANIAGVVHDLRAHIPTAEVLVVDDGSTDDTARRARAAGARVARLPFNLGVGAAMQTGFLAALDGGYDAAVQVDGDGQHPASEIAGLLAPILGDEADVVIGSRYLDNRGYVTPAGRRVGQRYFSGLVRMISGRRFTDTTSGFRAYNRTALAYVARSYSRDYPEVNALVALARAGFRLREVPVTMRDRQGGASHISAWRALYYMTKVPLASFMSATRSRIDR
jgi:hypothetical protein